MNVVVESIGELLLSELTERHWLRVAYDRRDCMVCSDRARSKGRRQTVQVQSVWGRSVHCAMQ